MRIALGFDTETGRAIVTVGNTKIEIGPLRIDGNREQKRDRKRRKELPDREK